MFNLIMKPDQILPKSLRATAYQAIRVKGVINVNIGTMWYTGVRTIHTMTSKSLCINKAHKYEPSWWI